MLPFDEQFTEPDIGAHAAKAHFVRVADLHPPKMLRDARTTGLVKLQRSA